MGNLFSNKANYQRVVGQNMLTKSTRERKIKNEII